MIFLGRARLVLAIVFITESIALAQTFPYNFDTRPRRGFLPTANLVASPVDSIDTVDGKLNLEIPLASLPAGPSSGGFQLNLSYDSHIYDMEPGPDIQRAIPFPLGGWAYNFRNYKIDGEERFTGTVCTQPYSLVRYRIGLPDGSQHLLHLRGYESTPAESANGWYSLQLDGKNYACPNNPIVNDRLTYFTNDGSFLKFEIDADGTNWDQKAWILHYPDGTRVLGRGSQVEQILDTNDNGTYFVNFCDDFPNCSGPTLHTVIADNFDRWMVIDYNAGNANLNEATAYYDLIAEAGPAGPGSVLWGVIWEIKRVGGSGPRPYVCNPQFSVMCNLDFEYWAVTSIQLPVGPLQYPPIEWNSYIFGYSDDENSGFGELDYMRTASGAIYEYRYLWENSTPATEQLISYNSVSQKKITHDGSIETWTYTFSDDNSIFHDNQTGAETKHFFYSRSGGGWDAGLVHKIVEPEGRVRKRFWSQNKPYGVHSVSTSLSRNNPYILSESTSVGDTSGVPLKSATVHWFYDKNGNVLAKLERDWATYDPDNIETGGPVRRMTGRLYYMFAPEASTISDHASGYWRPHPPNLWYLPRPLDRLFREEICETDCNAQSSTTKTVTELVYDDPFTKGNVIAEKRWNSSKSASVPPAFTLGTSNAQVLTRIYDVRGNVTELGGDQVHTKFTFDPVPGITGPGPYPTKIESAFDSTLKRTWTFNWNYGMGLVNSRTDLDNSVSTVYTYDTVGRTTKVDEGLRSTVTVYDDAIKKILVKRDRASKDDGLLQSRSSYDHLGRVKLVQTSDGANLLTDADGIKVQIQYVLWAERRLVISSKPYRTLDDTTEWLCVQHDLLGRVTHSPMFRGANAPTSCNSSSFRTGVTTTAYDKEITMLTDPAGKTIYYYKDSLGRLVQAIEDFLVQPLPTRYVYDALNNLCRASQYESGAGELDPFTSCTASQVTGVQHRKYVYSSLGRLLSAENPESGQTIYTYKDYGSIASRTDVRGFKVDFDYDELHRLKEKDYSNDLGRTPDVMYTYHPTGAPNIGQLKSISSSAATTSYLQYDSLGRVLDFKQTIGSTDYPFVYTWWLHDAVKTVTYPSLRKVSYDVDNAGRVEKVYVPDPYTPLVPLKIYANLTSLNPPTKPYTPDGRVAWLQLGNDLWETYNYQPPGTTTTFKLGTAYDGNEKLELQYNYSGTANNGNLMSHVIKQGGNEWTQQIGPGGYDAYNRLISVTETKTGGGSWNQTYGYDRFGNRWVSQSSLAPDPWEPTVSTNFSTSNNRINVQSPTFDTAGNQTLYKGSNIDYDAENRSVKMTNALSGTADFSYDGEGRRVVKSWDEAGAPPALLTHYVYDAFGDLAATYSNDNDVPVGTSFPFADALGSIRAITGPKPSVGSAALLECFDYSPFGRPLGVGNQRPGLSCYPDLSQTPTPTPRMPQRFTGKEREQESGLDFFGARYYSPPQGRFTSADQPLIDQDLFDPQSWNLYAYVRNNPLRYIDPDGKACVIGADGKEFDDNRGGQSCADARKPTENDQISATAYAGPSAVRLEVDEILGIFAGNGVKEIVYQPDDPYTQDFKKSAGMVAISIGIKSNCSAQSGQIPVRPFEAFVNTLIDSGLGFQGPNAQAQLGAFVATYNRQANGTVNITVTNNVSVNSALYHAIGNNRLGNKQGGFFGTVRQTLQIVSTDPCK